MGEQLPVNSGKFVMSGSGKEVYKMSVNLQKRIWGKVVEM